MGHGRKGEDVACNQENLYMSSRSAVLLEGKKSDSFNVEQGVAQGCSLSPILFSVFIKDLFKEEQAELGIQLSSGKIVGGMLFADDFVGVKAGLQYDARLAFRSVTPQLSVSISFASVKPFTIQRLLSIFFLAPT